MSVTPSAPAPEQLSPQVPRLAAFVCADNDHPDAVFESLVARCRRLGWSVAGVLQHRISTDPMRRCDVVLENLSTGNRTTIFEDRGAGASGCKLDQGALADVAGELERRLEDGPDLLVLNKFGKAECCGEGLIDLIVSAMDREIAVVIGVPESNLAAWRKFAGDLCVELSGDAAGIERWLEDYRQERARVAKLRRELWGLLPGSWIF